MIAAQCGLATAATTVKGKAVTFKAKSLPKSGEIIYMNGEAGIAGEDTGVCNLTTHSNGQRGKDLRLAAFQYLIIAATLTILRPKQFNWQVSLTNRALLKPNSSQGLRPRL